MLPRRIFASFSGNYAVMHVKSYVGLTDSAPLPRTLPFSYNETVSSAVVQGFISTDSEPSRIQVRLYKLNTIKELCFT